ncbi:hypothetical protein [Bacillus sp. MMSF_3353]|uniref:hypothetical protein n=1 Tax=Bacillus sp. MMSF_3353 TaxID=3047081 RepID=UPI00273D199A|nr:hypothetical protein [Bacillus sp. MMSF_3353]
MLKFIKRNSKEIGIILAVAVFTPIILGLVLNIPTGHLTIGDENSWVGFFGSYTGGIIGGIVALIIASSQVINDRKKNKESQRSFLSATTTICDFSKGGTWRKKEGRTVITKGALDLNLDWEEHETTYYSVIRYGGPDIIVNCNFQIIIGKDKIFSEEEIIEVWLDYFGKDEEILIPLCTKKFTGVARYQPAVKEIQVVYGTLAGEKIKFQQTEKEMKRIHWLIGDKEEEILAHDIRYTAFKQKQ